MTADRKRMAIAGLAGGWLAILVIALVLGIPAEERSLAAASQSALAAADIESVEVRFDGRDALLAGPAEDRDAALAAVATVVGVRAASWTDVVIEGAAATAPVTVTTSSPATTVAEAPPAAQLHAELDRGRLTIDGVIPSREAAQALRSTAALIYAPYVTDRLLVSDVERASWVPTTARVVAVLPILGSASIAIEGETAVVSGSAPTATRKAAFLSAMSDALGPGVAIEDEIEVSGLAAPRFSASAAGDGTVVLDGAVPDEQIADGIVSAAVDSFGAENVVSRLVVDDGVDVTFSLFRLPLVIPQLAEIPQWDVSIDDDVIVGTLRGGATFASGSAELTPELRALLDTAAGILTRNPRLAMVIEGHTDSVGDAEANLELSERRATNAATYLVAAGVGPDRVTAVGIGEDRPIASNETTEGRAMNRRVEFGFGPATTRGGT